MGNPYNIFDLQDNMENLCVDLYQFDTYNEDTDKWLPISTLSTKNKQKLNGILNKMQKEIDKCRKNLK